MEEARERLLAELRNRDEADVESDEDEELTTSMQEIDPFVEGDETNVEVLEVEVTDTSEETDV